MPPSPPAEHPRHHPRPPPAFDEPASHIAPCTSPRSSGCGSSPSSSCSSSWSLAIIGRIPLPAHRSPSEPRPCYAQASRSEAHQPARCSAMFSPPSVPPRHRHPCAGTRPDRSRPVPAIRPQSSTAPLRAATPAAPILTSVIGPKSPTEPLPSGALACTLSTRSHRVRAECGRIWPRNYTGRDHDGCPRVEGHRADNGC